jgi:DNA-binding MarR family transcriptional regulator
MTCGDGDGMVGDTTGEQTGLRYLSLAYRVRKVVDQQMVTAGVSLARAKVLQVIDEQGPQRQVSLADTLGLAPRSVTQTVEALERDGLVSRVTDPDDGRAKLVALTPAGTDALATGVAAGAQALREIFGGLGPTRLARLDKLLDAIDNAATSH